MRNLQKILALVLALMMSVSLVATAGAFSDDGDITDVYKDAVTVLNGLDVFKGYDNGATFQPKGNITRAEVAAIIYRIATGDVTDSQASIYSTYGQFTDVADGSWYSGYVNYCANAGYIKGRGNKIFDPQGQVTGYEALAMILRAVGYDKNGEFTGSNWQIRTASIANERGITKNVTSAQLGQAATRETVAEILFRSIVIPKVNFNANTLSYTEKPLNADGKKDTLGYESLKLEEITGIVTANEYADLDNSVTLNTDKTRMRVSGVDGGNYILDYGEATLLEGLDAIGEEHNAYIQNANTTSAKVLLMAKTDNNKTYETLEKVEIDTDSKFREKTGLQRSETATEHYLNFDEVKDWRSDWRIKYVISSVNTVANTIDEVNREISRINANTNFELPTLANLNADTLARAGYALIPDGTTGRFFIEYTKEFRVDTTIGSVDRGNIEEIFNIADRLTKNDYVRGEVYVGTSSLKDISDEISYKQFVEQYINNDGDKKITKNENGNWLKVIDNDNDGQADYVLKVVYTMAQVVRASGGEYGLDTEDLNLCSWNRASYDESVNFLDDDDVVSEDTLALDDIVYYAVIDGVPRATKAETATVKIDTVNRKDLRVTTTDSVEYVESGVCEEIDSDDYTSGVTNMNGSATYDIYLDRGGYLAAFTDSHGGDFTLIVDGWYNSTKGGIEYAVRAYNDETGRQDVVDVTRGGGMFIGRDVQWTDQVDNNDWRALKWLGGTKDTEALTNRVTATGTYGAGKLNGEGYANTNDVKTTVATLTDDGMIQPVDYTSVGSKVVRMLATKDNEIPDSSASYQAEVYETSSSLSATDTAYNRLESGNAELRALSTTVYYLVYPSKNAETGFAVEKYTGYASVPSVDDGFIEDVYAVGTLQERNSTLGGKDYYTANVVVVELKSTFRGYAEQVFIYNMPEAGNRVGIESVDLIHENGENETGVKIDFALSNVRDYRVAHNVNSSIWENTHWRPGLYYLYPTNTADLYTVQPMDANDIAQNDYVVGWSSTSDATAKTDHVSVIAFSNDVHVGGANIEIAYGEVTKAVSNVYRIGYDSKGIADLSTYKLDEGNLLSFVDERVDVTSGVNTYDYNKYDHYPYDRDNHPNACDICWNQNLILMHYTGNTANYTISFENDNSLAEDVWSNNMPSTLAWNDAADVNKNLSRDDAVSYAQFMLKCADPVNDANGLPTNVYYNARYHIDQAVKTAMAGTLEVKKNRVDSVADNLITQLKGGTTDPDPAKYNAAADAYNAAKAATPDLANAELTVLENIKTLIQTAKNDPSYSKLSQTQKDNLDAWETEVQTAIDSKDTIKVTVQFVDESGNPVTGLADFTKDGEAGAQMEIPLTVAGYTVVSVDNGTLNADKTAVIITPAADATVKVTVKAETSEEEKYVLTFAPTLKDGTFDVTVNGVIAADGAEISKGDVIALNPARVLDITGVDENGAVTGNVTVSIKEGFTWSNMFGGWMGVDDAGNLITIPYDSTVAAARMRARAANDSAADWSVGPVDTTVEGWFAKMIRDYGATYTITVGNVVWKGEITEGGTTWKLFRGSVEEAKAAVIDIDTADVEKTGMAPDVSNTSKLPKAELVDGVYQVPYYGTALSDAEVLAKLNADLNMNATSVNRTDETNGVIIGGDANNKTYQQVQYVKVLTAESVNDEAPKEAGYVPANSTTGSAIVNESGTVTLATNANYLQENGTLAANSNGVITVKGTFKGDVTLTRGVRIAYESPISATNVKAGGTTVASNTWVKVGSELSIEGVTFNNSATDVLGVIYAGENKKVLNGDGQVLTAKKDKQTGTEVYIVSAEDANEAGIVTLTAKTGYRVIIGGTELSGLFSGTLGASLLSGALTEASGFGSKMAGTYVLLESTTVGDTVSYQFGDGVTITATIDATGTVTGKAAKAGSSLNVEAVDGVITLFPAVKVTLKNTIDGGYTYTTGDRKTVTEQFERQNADRVRYLATGTVLNLEARSINGNNIAAVEGTGETATTKAIGVIVGDKSTATYTVKAQDVEFNTSTTVVDPSYAAAKSEAVLVENSTLTEEEVAQISLIPVPERTDDVEPVEEGTPVTVLEANIPSEIVESAAGDEIVFGVSVADGYVPSVSTEFDNTDYDVTFVKPADNTNARIATTYRIWTVIVTIKTASTEDISFEIVIVGEESAGDDFKQYVKLDTSADTTIVADKTEAEIIAGEPAVFNVTTDANVKLGVNSSTAGSAGVKCNGWNGSKVEWTITIDRPQEGTVVLSTTECKATVAAAHIADKPEESAIPEANLYKTYGWDDGKNLLYATGLVPHRNDPGTVAPWVGIVVNQTNNTATKATVTYMFKDGSADEVRESDLGSNDPQGNHAAGEAMANSFIQYFGGTIPQEDLTVVAEWKDSSDDIVAVTSFDVNFSIETAEAGVQVVAAKLHDTRVDNSSEGAIADNKLYKTYELTGSNGNYTITSDVREHQNGNTPTAMGRWVGVAFAPEGDLAGVVKYATITMNDGSTRKTYPLTQLIAELDTESGDKLSYGETFYFSSEGLKEITIDWFVGNGENEEPVGTSTFTVNVVLNAEATFPSESETP